MIPMMIGLKKETHKGGTGMKQEEMKQRTKLFALGVIHLVESLPKERTAEVLGRQ